MNFIKSIQSLRTKSLIEEIDLGFYNVKSKKLIEIYLSNSQMNDLKLSVELNNEDKDTTNLRKIRSRLNKKLLDNVFNNIASRFNPDERLPNIVYLNKLRAVGFALRSINIVELGNKVFEHILKKAEIYDAPDLCYDSAMVLFNIHALSSPDEKKLLYYETLVKRYFDESERIKKVTILYGKLVHQRLIRRVGSDIFDNDESLELFNQLLELKSQSDNYIVQLLVHDMEATYYLATNNFKAVIETCSAAKGMLENKSFTDKALKWSIHYNSAYSHLKLKEYKLVDHHFEELELFLTKGSKYWFVYKGLVFMSFCLKGDIENTFQLIKEVFDVKDLYSYSNELSIWLCRAKFLKSLLKMKRYDATREKYKDLLPRLNTNKFKDQLNDFVKDKTGMNITLKTIEIMDKLVDLKYDEVDDLIDSFAQYQYKYLTKDESFRSRCFVKMLQVMQKSYFHPVRTTQLSSALYKRLLDTESEIEQINLYVELIPYDQMWSLLLEILIDNRNNS